MKEEIKNSLIKKINPLLVEKLLDSYCESKSNFYTGKLRIHEVEGGRFCEAAFRILQEVTTQTFTPLGTPLNTDKIIDDLRQVPKALAPDSIRLHIPRSLRVVYDIRNTRDAAHLADGISPNLQDATFVVTTLDWVLAEFIRLYHTTTANEAQKIIDCLVQKKAPAIQDFDGVFKVLNPRLSASLHCLALLYARGTIGATFEELYKWVPPKMRSNLRRTLHQLTHDKLFIHAKQDSSYIITRTGEIEAEKFLALSW